MGASANPVEQCAIGFNDFLGNYCLLILQPWQSGFPPNSAWIQMQWKNGAPQGVIAASPITLALSATHTLTMQYDGADLTAKIDGTTYATVPVTATLNGLQPYFYILWVTTLTAAAPSITRLRLTQPPI